jgi:hypothetical protein
VHVRIDERGREHEALAVDDAVPVRVDARPEPCDRPRVDADVEDSVEALAGVEDARTADEEALLAPLAEQHHAAPISCRAPASTPAGPWVSRS